MNVSRPVFVSLMATCNRPSLLAKRSLPSIAAQVRRPDLLIIADDSAPQFRARNKKTVEEFSEYSGIRAVYIVNRRSKGACGAWNTGALAALAEKQYAKNIYLAILDDDDEWMPKHLTQAESAMRGAAHGVDLMAAAFERRETKRSYVVNPPTELSGRDFLVGNPGVVGSTLIIRLTAFLRAGMFDESLPACTDKDLCFRLLLLPNIAYKPLLDISVIHYADDKRIRISNPHGAVKFAGLSRFADKYRGWMSDVEYTAYCRRAKKMFGWAENKPKIVVQRQKNVVTISRKKNSDKKISLIIGVIVPPDEKNNPLFLDILELSKDKRLYSVDVVVMPSSGMHIRRLQNEMIKCRHAGLRMHCISDIKTPWHDFLRIVNLRKKRPISINRTILQHAVSRFAVLYKNPVCWILDGDNRLHGLKFNERELSNFRPDYIGEMIRLRDSGCDIAIGKINGAAPLPRALTVRTQMIDLLHAVGRLRQATYSHCPMGTVSDIISGTVGQNYYHDCLPHPHLEQPIGTPLLLARYSPQDTVRQLPSLLNRVLAGDAVTRPLVEFDNKTSSRPVHRGGNTLIFNSDVLCECPNGLAKSNYSGMRREDEVWRIFSESAFGRTVVGGDFPVTQSRENDLPQAPDIDRMAEDIVGHAVIVALKGNINKKYFNGVQALVNFLLHDRHDFMGEIRCLAEDRLTLTRASFFRICGVADSMRGIIEQAGNERIHKNAIASLQNIVSRFSDKKMQTLRRRVIGKLNDSIQSQIFSNFPKFCRDYAAIGKIWTIWIAQERKKNARIILDSAHPLRFLGQGNEGAVFTDNKRVFKVLHRWYSRVDVVDANFLPSVAKNWKTDEGLHPIGEIRHDSGDLILTMPYEKTTHYKGGCGVGMVAMLADMKRRGIVLWDMAPKNLRQKGNMVRLIDYGQQIHPFTEKSFDLSIRKAWLCWRWAFRDDLRALLVASLNNRDMPELAGYERMKDAVGKYAERFKMSDLAIKSALCGNPRNILDYGCGKGRDAEMLAKRGFCVSAYDPMLTQESENRLKLTGVHVIKDISKASGGYDVILLRHVICEIKSTAALQKCFNNVHRLVTSKGRVVVTTCDSNGLVKDNTCAHNIIPRSADMTKKFLYQKYIRPTCEIRAHVHRPENMLLREFSRAGFRIESQISFADIDLNLFESCGGTLQWRLCPLPPRLSASLIIRACAMDAEYFEFQVKHLVEQLNYPRGFSEVIVAIDSKKENFLRQHTRGDLSSIMSSARQLQQQGWIDSIIVAPTDKSVLVRMNRKWLGIEGDFSHTQNGVPFSVVFTAFDYCRTRYALHIDIDVIIGRINKNHDYLGGMLKTMKQRDVFTMALDIPGADISLREDKENPFRLEVAAGLTDIQKLKQLRPLPMRFNSSAPKSGWHRMADIAIHRDKLISLRGGGQWLFALYTPNQFKNRRDNLDIIANVAKRGLFPVSQNQNNIWNGDSDEWLPPCRHEKFIFVICGRNVSIGKIDRCLNSIVRQKNRNWGAVIMDDASHAFCAGHLLRWENSDRKRFMYFARRNRAGGLANLVFAVSRLCSDPQSIIITLDMDDALIGDGVLDRLSLAYAQGADMTSGSMLRTDKQSEYTVCFDDPRLNRGGNVWQHLRSFRKRLFDQVPDSALRDNNGEYFELAQDWAYMLPIVEMAKCPVWIKDFLYLYDPEPKRQHREKSNSESAIARIVSRPAVLSPPQYDYRRSLQEKNKK